jgi:hypothetical protein
LRAAPGGETLGNPSSCTILDRSGTRRASRVIVEPGGRYRRVGTGITIGCCVDVPRSTEQPD